MMDRLQEKHIVTTIKTDPGRGFRMLMGRYGEPVYWHIRRQELILVQAAHIADRLGLDKKTTERFTETYCSFQQEIWNLGPRPGRLSPDAGEEETGEYLRSRFAQSRRILDLREKYYHLYSEFLTQKQIQQIYRIEREMMDRLSGRGKDNAAHGPEQKPAYAPGKRH